MDILVTFLRLSILNKLYSRYDTYRCCQTMAILVISRRHTSTTCCNHTVSGLDRQTLLRSTSKGDLVVPHTRFKFGERAFKVADLQFRNKLPSDIRKTPFVNPAFCFIDSLPLFFFPSPFLISPVIFISYPNQLGAEAEGAVSSLSWACVKPRQPINDLVHVSAKKSSSGGNFLWIFLRI